MAKRTEAELVERQTPRGLVTHAGEYFKTAEIVATSVGFDDIHGGLKRPGYMHPFYFLTGHSLELAMKAILLENGHTHAKLRSYGHDLVKAWTLVRPTLKDRKHRAVYVEFKKALELLNVYYQAKDLEYRVTGQFSLPRARTILDAAREFWTIANVVIALPSREVDSK